MWNVDCRKLKLFSSCCTYVLLDVADSCCIILVIFDYNLSLCIRLVIWLAGLAHCQVLYYARTHAVQNGSWIMDQEMVLIRCAPRALAQLQLPRQADLARAACVWSINNLCAACAFIIYLSRRVVRVEHFASCMCHAMRNLCFLC